MASDMTGLYVQEYNSSLDSALQQKTSVLSSLVTDMGFFEGTKIYLPKIDNKEAQDLTREGNVQATDPATGFYELTSSAKEASHILYDTDKGLLNERTRSLAAAQAAEDDVSALMRAKDAIIYSALEAAAADTTEGTMQTVGTYDKKLSLIQIADAARKLGTNYAWDAGDMAIVLPFGVNLGVAMDLNALLKTNQTDPVVSAMGGFLDPLKTLKVGQYEMVSQHAGTGANIGCNLYLFNKKSVAAAHNNMLEKFDKDIDPTKSGLGRVIGAWLRMGAKVRNKKGVIQLKCLYNFEMDYEALRTKQVA